MRILICTGDGGGNVPPTVAIAAELIHRGHTVRVLAGPYYPGAPPSATMEAAFAAVGCEVTSPPPDLWAGGAIPDLTSIPEHFMMVRTMALWAPVSLPWAQQTTDLIQTYQPDVVVTDLITPGAGIAAEATGTPCVILLTTVPVHRQLPGLPLPGRGALPSDGTGEDEQEYCTRSREVAMPFMNTARAAVGLVPDDDPWAWEDRAARVIVLSSRVFDYPAASYPSNMVYAGSMRPSSPGGGWDSPWPLSADGPPLVVVSGTTTGLSGLWFSVFQASANALLELDMRGVFTIGPLDPQMFPQHQELAYQSFVPHSDVLPHASALVTQCGHGATLTALRHGLPMVCVPVFADQPDVAARVEHLGAGIRLTTQSAPGEFRDAIAAVVQDPRYREAARKIAAELADEDGAVSAADATEAAAHPV
jgi:MGT family glycosyltransferase